MTRHHNQPATQLTRHLANEADTLALGAALAVGLNPGMVVYLKGELGAGKTTLVRGLLRALGVTERVKSPTYTLVEPYTVSRLYLYHFDFYRLRYTDEWVDAGFRDYFNGDAVCLVEWPEKAGRQLPAPDVTIEMAVAGDGRSIAISAETEAGRNCLMRLQN
jgi:tRNA threonylcarbamoyladenosine biosynthesis protein TsaE